MGANWPLFGPTTLPFSSGFSIWPSRRAITRKPPLSWIRSARSRGNRERNGGSPRRCSWLTGRRRGRRQQLAEARRIAAELTQGNPQWPGGHALSGEIAELSGSPDQAVSAYLEAIKLGNLQPGLVRRLIVLLSEQKRFDEIDRVARMLPGEGRAVPEITLVKALEAIRKQDFDRGLTLARQVFPESSTSASDHLNMGRH